MRRVQPARAQIKSFLDGAIIDPNKKGEFIANQLVDQGTPDYFELRVIEYIQEATQIRQRMKSSSGKGLTTLKEQYRLKMTQAATALAISVGKVDGPEGHQIRRKARSKDTKGNDNVSSGSVMDSSGDTR